MSKAIIQPGACGLSTTVTATMNGSGRVDLHIESECKAVRVLAENLPDVDPYAEYSFRRGLPQTLQKGIDHCSHTSCPVPVGILKAVEIAAGLNLPSDVHIRLSKE
jgi:hypothetical protein